MARQRWGSFSVRDHLNTRALATDVLLYDRLVFPVPPKGDEKALAYWEKKEVAAGLLESRLLQLKGLTRGYRWGREQHELFKSRFPKLKAQFDLENMAKKARGELPYWETRMMIAQDHANIVPEGLDADVVAAYQTRRAFSADFILKEQRDRDAQLGYLVSFMISCAGHRQRRCKSRNSDSHCTRCELQKEAPGTLRMAAKRRRERGRNQGQSSRLPGPCRDIQCRGQEPLREDPSALHVQSFDRRPRRRGSGVR